MDLDTLMENSGSVGEHISRILRLNWQLYLYALLISSSVVLLYCHAFISYLGNENIHSLTGSDSFRVRFDLMTFDKKWAYAEYSKFVLGPESKDYQLIIGGYSGNACG